MGIVLFAILIALMAIYYPGMLAVFTVIFLVMAAITGDR